MNTTIQQQIDAVNKIRTTIEQMQTIQPKDTPALLVWVRSEEVQELLKTINDAANTLQAVRLIGIEKVMYAGEMYDLLNSFIGSGWLNTTQMQKMNAINKLIFEKIHKYQP